jgi:hypothetical protein
MGPLLSGLVAAPRPSATTYHLPPTCGQVQVDTPTGQERPLESSQVAAPDRPCVAVCGDGGFAMTMNALLTAAQYRIPVTTVVLNNGAPFWQVQSPLAKEGPGGE